MQNFCELTVTALSGGILYPLNNIDGWILDTYDGLGIPNVSRHAQRGPFQAGDSDLGFTLRPRFLSFAWTLQGCTVAQLWDFRCKMIAIFRPRSDTPVVLQIALPNGKIIATDVHMQGILDYPVSSRIDGKTQRVALGLKASDPRLYNPEEQSISFTTAQLSGGWNVEEDGETTIDGWTVEENGETTLLGWNIGGSTIENEQSIDYANSAGCPNADVEYPVIRMNGSLNNPIIENLTTEEILPLTYNGGLAIATGDWVEIDLNYSAKTIKDQDGNSVDEFLDPVNDLATFHFAYAGEEKPDGTFHDGVNVIKITAQNATLASSVDITWYERFIGV